MNIKYIFVHLLDDFSGSPRVLSNLISSLESEHEKLVITNNGKGHLYNLQGCQYFRLPYSTSSSKYLTLIKYLLNQFFLFVFLFCYLSVCKFKYNKVELVVNTLLPFSGILAARILNVHVTTYIHESYLKPRLLMHFLTSVVKFFSSRAIFVSNYLKDFHFCISNRIPSVIVANSLPHDFGISSPLIDVCDRDVILFVGSLRKYKGVDLYICLAEKFPTLKFKMVLNASQNEIDTFKFERDVPSNVEFILRPSNIQDYYKQALITLNLTDPHECIETFGLTLIESFSHGVPVIAPNFGGPKEIVTLETGVLLSTLDIFTLESAVNEVLLPESWLKRSHACYYRSKKYSFSEYNRNVNKLFL